ncbi:phage tail tape measure protein [Virgibacillus halodenitrificans]|uniref:phage tail tape measure protein n=1 Tax=Virgibacillus halodenitrificans TaxID=1482 RepID=UPI001EECF87E|nr:phage tail tape measure protein [Virgibacillus halodenitrificans]MCG1029317.1 phage tail tape measure protein [Virgibacillus halodenitrificans]
MAKDVIADLVAQISFDGTQFQKGMGQVNRQLKTVQEELKTARSRFRQTGDSTEFLGNKSKTLSGKLKLQQERVKLLTKAYEESKKNSNEFSKNTQNLATKLEKAKRELGETEHELKDVNEQLNTKRWKDYGKAVENAGDRMQRVGQGMSSFGRSYTMHVTTPIVAGSAAIFKASMDFESAFTGVEKTVEGTTEQMQGLRQGIRDMAKEIPASTTEIAAVAEAAGQLGIQTDSVEEFTRTMIDLGEATNLTSEQAATEFARFANIVGMSQDDFDKLGSSTVALGNSMATTESEISSMSLRLAAQGNQVGMTEAQIVALAASMSSLGIEAEAGGTAMTMVLKKIDKAVGDSGDELNEFAKVAGVSSSDFAKAWENDAVGALDLFIKGLAESGEEGANLTTILSDLGIKGIRESDTILRLAGASDILSGAVNTSTEAWKENSALSEEASKRYATTESLLKILWNRIKDIGITLGDALVPALMDAIEAAEPLIEKIESGAQAFSDMSEEEQRTILKMIALAAAVGPVSVGLGGLTTTVGGLTKMTGGLIGALGRKGGAGLLGRIGLMGLGSTPVGLAVLGVGALGTGIYALSKASEDNLEKTVESIQARKDEINALDQTIEAYEKLQNKNKLTTDEVLRYMDVMTELKEAKSEEAIQKLKDEQAELLKKSGLTNKEMEEFLRLNGKLVEDSPSTVNAISEQGNAYASNLEELKKLNAFERQRLADETYMTLTNEIDKQTRNLEKQAKLQQQIEEKENQRTEIQNKILGINKQIREVDLLIAGLQNDLVGATKIEREEIENKIRLAQQEKTDLSIKKDYQEQLLEQAQKDIDKKQTSLDKTDKQLKQFEVLKDEYAQMLLYEQGIVSEKGKAVDEIKQQQKEIDTAKAKLKEQWNQGKLTRSEYENQNEKLREQQGKIDVVKQKLGEMNTIAGETIYKDLNINENPSADSINSKLGKSIWKKVNLDIPISPASQMLGVKGYAKGVKHHDGGPAVVGEEGPELVRQGDQWSLHSFGLIPDLKTGAQVFTNKETNKILGALNQIPGYASGTSPAGEADRITSQLNRQISAYTPTNGDIIVEVPVILEGREVARGTYRYTKSMIEQDEINEMRDMGVNI